MTLSHRSLVCALTLLGGAATAAAQEAACKPLYDATIKALDQPGVERKVSVANDDGSKMTMDTRKTEAGWYATSNGGTWFPLASSPELMERKLVHDPKAYMECKLVGSEDLGGESAQVWTYVSRLGGDPVAAKIWISAARQLPLRVESGKVVQTSTYSDKPYPKP